jgi:cell division ATPase FtsA
MNTPESSVGRRDFLRTTGVAGLALGLNLQRCFADALRPGPTTAKAAIMPGAEIIVGLDIGTSKVRVAVGERRTDGAIKILGVGQARSLGVRCGEIVDSEAASKCVMKAFVDAEEKTDVMIGTTHLAVFNKISAYGSSTTARKKINCVHALGLEIANLAHIPFSSALAVLNPDQKKLGALVIDLGAGTTSYIALAGDRVQHWAIRVVGGDHITNDLSLGLRIPMARAERLKIEEGSVRLGRSMHGERIMVTDEHGFSAREVEREMLNTIIHCRVRDTFDRMKAHLETKGVYLDSLASGVHLTGGGSMLRGIEDLAQEVFGIPVHRARAKGIIWAATALESPRYSCAVGLLKPGADHTRIANLRGYRSGWADADDVC